MGVKDLWKILEPARQPVGTGQLKGLTLAVDLSVWVCEAEGVHEMRGRVTKPYLRNIFFRVCNLQQLGVSLIFVVDGEAPELKLEEMARRTQARYGQSRGRGRGYPVSKQKPGRSHFRVLLRECCELLELMGIPFVQSRGEAEALCALLNQHRIVDGCITNDGDAFLYGATTVFRNFTIDRKAQENIADMYTLDDIQSKLNLDREKLIALGLLLGCDFVPKGVPGVGQCRAVKLMEELSCGGVLERMSLWQSDRFASASPIELQIREKSFSVLDFPSHKVIAEFTKAKDTLPRNVPKETRPKLFSLQRFLVTKLEWEEDYALDKALPLLTMYDMRQICRNPAYRHGARCLKPHSIVKARVKQFVAMYEVQWYRLDGDSVVESDYYVTLEEQGIFTKCFPQLVENFEASKNRPKEKKMNKKTKASEKENKDPAQGGDDLETTCRELAALQLTNSGCHSDPLEKSRGVNESDVMSAAATLSLRDRLKNQIPSKRVHGLLKDHPKGKERREGQDQFMNAITKSVPLSLDSRQSRGNRAGEARSRDSQKPIKSQPFLDDSIDDLLFDIDGVTSSTQALRHSNPYGQIAGLRTLSNVTPSIMCVQRVPRQKRVSPGLSYSVVRLKNKDSFVKENTTGPKGCMTSHIKREADNKTKICEKHVSEGRSSVRETSKELSGSLMRCSENTRGNRYAQALQAAIRQVTGHMVHLHTDRVAGSQSEAVVTTPTGSDDEECDMLPLSQRILLRASQSDAADPLTQSEKHPNSARARKANKVFFEKVESQKCQSKAVLVGKGGSFKSRSVKASGGRITGELNMTDSESELFFDVESERESQAAIVAKSDSYSESGCVSGVSHGDCSDASSHARLPGECWDGSTSGEIAQEYSHAEVERRTDSCGKTLGWDDASNDASRMCKGDSVECARAITEIPRPSRDPESTVPESAPLRGANSLVSPEVNHSNNSVQSEGGNFSLGMTLMAGDSTVVSPPKAANGSFKETDEIRTPNHGSDVTSASSRNQTLKSECESYKMRKDDDAGNSNIVKFSADAKCSGEKWRENDQKSVCDFGKTTFSGDCPTGICTPDVSFQDEYVSEKLEKSVESNLKVECFGDISTPEREAVTWISDAVDSRSEGHEFESDSGQNATESSESTRSYVGANHRTRQAVIGDPDRATAERSRVGNAINKTHHVASPCVGTSSNHPTNHLALVASRDFADDYSPIITCDTSFGLGFLGNRVTDATPVSRRAQSHRNQTKNRTIKRKDDYETESDKKFEKSDSNITIYDYASERQKFVKFGDVMGTSRSWDTSDVIHPCDVTEACDTELSDFYKETVIMRRSFNKTFMNDDTVTILFDDQSELDASYTCK